MIGFFFVLGLFCIESGTDLTALIVTTAMLGKFGIAGSYAIVFLYASELYPTVVRYYSLLYTCHCLAGISNDLPWPKFISLLNGKHTFVLTVAEQIVKVQA